MLNNLITSVGGKKMLVNIGAAAAIVLALVCKSADPEMVKTIISVIGTICTAFHIGQGLADGLSGGKTSHAADAVAQSKDVG